MRRSPLHIDLSPKERSTLESWLRCATTPNGLAQRVRVVLRFAADSQSAARRSLQRHRPQHL